MISSSFLSLAQSYALLFANAKSKSRLSIMHINRKEFLIRNKFGISTINLFFDLALQAGSNFIIECGANDASVSRRFIRGNSGSRAIAIEANPFVYEKFKAINAIPSLDYIQTGLSDKKKKVQFNIPNVTDRDTSIFGSFQKLPKYYQDYTSISIDTDKLDSLVKKTLFSRDSKVFMWIDVEGEAYNLFCGADKLLNLGVIKVIYVEVQESDHYKEERVGLEIAELLGKYGFEPVARDFPLADLYNLVFIHKSELKYALPVLNRYWSRLYTIKAPFIEFRRPNRMLSWLKKSLLNLVPSNLHSIVHRVLAVLGSKSSRTGLNS